MNRRTELKVVGFLDVDPLRDKSLADIKDEERIEALLREVQQSEVIEIPAGEELPEDLKKQIESEKEDGGNEKDAEEEDMVVELESDNVESEMAEEDEFEQVVSEAKDDEETDKQSNNALDQIFEQIDQAESSEEDVSPEITAGVQRIGAGTSGFFIQLFHASSILDQDHPYWSKLQGGFEDARESGGYSYLIGGFENRDLAIKALEATWQSEFPDAFIVQFEEGKRVK